MDRTEAQMVLKKMAQQMDLSVAQLQAVAMAVKALGADAVSRKLAATVAISAAEEASDGQWNVKRDLYIEKAIRGLPVIGEEAKA